VVGVVRVGREKVEAGEGLTGWAWSSLQVRLTGDRS
jgi:hypothetical protein